MGWLRELMDDAQPRVTSFGQLARFALSHPRWPEYATPQPRSLASQLSKLDRERELEWLDDRPDIQSVLVEVLQCGPAALTRALDRGLGRRDEEHHLWRPPDVPAARAVDLREEPLPPGLPTLLARPERWERVWWHATSRQERELVVRWLRARHLATIRKTGPDLSLPEHSSSPWLLLHDLGNALPEVLPLRCCLVTCGAVLSEDNTAKKLSGWTRIHPPAPEQLMDDVVQWLAPRLPQDERFDPEIAKGLLVQGWQDGVVDGLEAALGLAATLDELGVDDPHIEWRELALQLIDERLDNPAIRARPEGGWLRQNAPTILAGMLALAHERFANDWDAPRPPEQWMALVPDEFQQGVDFEWLQLSLGQGPSAVSSTQLHNALRRIPPGAFQIVRGLEVARLLKGSGELLLSPRWLLLWLSQSMQDQVLQGPAEQWGEALLQPSRAPSLKAGLQADLRRDSSYLLESLMDLDNPQDASSALTVETIFELVGWSILTGEEFDSEGLTNLWELQADLWVELEDGLVVPRICHPWSDAALCGGWLVAAWAIAEQVAVPDAPAALDPWNRSAGPPLAAMDRVAACFEARNLDSDLLAAFALVGRLRRATKDIADHPLLLPFALSPQSSWEDWARATASRHAVPLLERHYRHSFESLANAAWLAWQQAGYPATKLLSPTAAHRDSFWPHLPVGVLEQLMADAHPFANALPFGSLSNSCQNLLLRIGYELAPADLRALPQSKLASTIEMWAELNRESALTAVWNTRPQEATLALEIAASEQRWPSCEHLLRSAPAAADKHLLPLIGRRVEQFGVSDPVVRAGRWWLQNVAASTNPGRLEAYSLLTQIENRLARARAASGGV